MAGSKGGLAINSIDANPYQADPIELLEAEIIQLFDEVPVHKLMMKKAKTGSDRNLHKRLFASKQKTLSRLIAIHPDGEETFLSR